ncbi:MAG: helix-turn-helix transcriptional regulator [Methylocella sp.]
MSHQTIRTPGGETLVILPLAEFEALRDAADAADHARAMDALARGEDERLTAKEALALAEAKTPLAFWRNKRVMTQGELSTRAGVSQSAIADMERGARVGTVAVLKRVAEALGVRIEDLVAEE